MPGMMYCQQCGSATIEEERQGRLRPVCVSCGAVTWLDPKLAVAVVIVEDGRILLGRRAPGSREAGRWSLPAGFVERGEVVEEAAAREVREETGLDVKIGELLTVRSYPGEPVVLLVYLSETVMGDPLPSDDLDRLGWFGPDDLPALAFEHDAEIVASLFGSNEAP